MSFNCLKPHLHWRLYYSRFSGDFLVAEKSRFSGRRKRRLDSRFFIVAENGDYSRQCGRGLTVQHVKIRPQLFSCEVLWAYFMTDPNARALDCHYRVSKPQLYSDKNSFID